MPEPDPTIRTDRYPEAEALKIWRDDDAILSVVLKPGASEESIDSIKAGLVEIGDHDPQMLNQMIGSMRGFFCGYARFPVRMLKAGVGEGLMPLVPAHGGIDYVAEDDDGSVIYGFSVAHSRDFTRAWSDEYVEGKVIQMAKGLRIAARYEPLIETAGSEADQRAVFGEFIDALADAGLEPSIEGNLPLTLRILGGLLSEGNERG